MGCELNKKKNLSRIRREESDITKCKGSKQVKNDHLNVEDFQNFQCPMNTNKLLLSLLLLQNRDVEDFQSALLSRARAKLPESVL